MKKQIFDFKRTKKMLEIWAKEWNGYIARKNLIEEQDIGDKTIKEVFPDIGEEKKNESFI